jgi:hypothetical protein
MRNIRVQMRCSRGGRAAVFTVILTTLLVLGETAADAIPTEPAGAASSGAAGAGQDVAVPDDPDGDAGQDVAVPAPDARAQLARAGATRPEVAAAAAITGIRLDDFRYDAQITEGYARDVCFGRLRTGTARTFVELQRRFGGWAGTLYACRERWNAAEEPDCNGTLVNPAVDPMFRSTCWSNHAQGRALDLMVGSAGGGYNSARGNAVVNWLLARDANGNYSANARRLGVQQILWRDHCWNTDDDRGVTSVRRMRECGIGHFDHVHIDLTRRGARGRTSYWGGTPVIEPKANGLMWWDQDTRQRLGQSWFNYLPRPRRAKPWGKRWDIAVAGDFDSDRVSDELFRWDRNNGQWGVSSWTGRAWRATRQGTWSTGWDQVITGDLDGDRRIDDLLQWDMNTGDWQVVSWSSGGVQRRTSGSWPASFDTARVGDFDEDNRLDDMFLRDRDTGSIRIVSWNRFVPSVRWKSSWGTAFDRFVVGDWDSDGELNDMLVQQSTTGAWRMMSWDRFRPTLRRTGRWMPRYRQFVAADLDGEGRIDDMLLRVPRSGRRLVIEWHYYRPRVRGPARISRGWDQIVSGQWG